MKDSPDHVFGFNYKFRGREFATHVEAATEQDAIDQIRAMSGAELVGMLLPAVSVPADA
jgi:hypothetical protein